MCPEKRLGVFLTSALALMHFACADQGRAGVRRAPPDAIPPAQTIPAGKVVIGVQLGKMRDSAELDAFRITKTRA